jgi:hypothetical protein
LKLNMNARVRFPDGEEAGRVTRMVIMPDQPDAPGVVIAVPGLITRQVIVPMKLLHEGPDGAVQVEVDPDTLDALPEYSPASYGLPPPGSAVMWTY